MPWVLARLVGGAILIGSAVAKLASPRRSREALGVFVPGRPRLAAAAWAAVVLVELALGALILAGVSAASYAAALLMLGFSGHLVVEIGRGRAGAPCGCFGARGKVGWPAVARSVALAALFAALPSLPEPHMSATAWLTAGLAVALAGVAGLGVAVLALAREVGTLRLAVGPQGALEIPEEGPPLGSRVDMPHALGFDAGAPTAVAVFSSDGCPMCQTLEPAVEFVARDPLIALRVFDEVRDADAWRALHVPGSPYAVALDPDGTVLAKGTFNSLGQLESVIATAVRRREEALHA
jgi:hypothetical protein